jgi:RNA polymerase sigma-70 factor, ECF subfamily
MSNGSYPFSVDLNAFNRLFTDHYPSLRAYAALLVGNDTAEDIVQDVFLNTWKNRDDINIHTSVRSYLFRSVYNRCLNKLGHLKMQHGKQRELEYALNIREVILSDPDKNPVIQKLYVNELREELHQAIENLPEKCREVFKLSYLNDHRNKEISEILNISVSTVEKHINHALKTLRKTLSHIKMLFLNFL